MKPANLDGTFSAGIVDTLLLQIARPWSIPPASAQVRTPRWAKRGALAPQRRRRWPHVCYTARMSLPHHNLAAWQRADDLFIDIHALTQNVFPREERYELSSQLRRAAYSVPANIVEGTQRKFPKESFHFCSIASGSLAEVGYGLYAARRLGYLTAEQCAEWEARIIAIAAPLNGLMHRYRTGMRLEPQPRGTGRP
jgi:four helix bundle protein